MCKKPGEHKTEDSSTVKILEIVFKNNYTTARPDLIMWSLNIINRKQHWVIEATKRNSALEMWVCSAHIQKEKLSHIIGSAVLICLI